MSIRACFLVLLALALGASCRPSDNWYVGHVTGGPGATGWHTCKGGGACREGWACVKDGCEWCGDADGVGTRCTNGNDSSDNGL